jgi:prolyl 4-hydroxylase
LQLTVRPRKGCAVFFTYPEASPSSLTLHAGCPVAAGEKWIANKWLRRKAFG